MRWPAKLLTLACLASALTIGCRKATGPSAEYAKASKLWQETVAQQGDGAGEDPRADEALALARSVDARSIDSDAARGLVKRIEEAQAEAQEEAEGVPSAPADDEQADDWEPPAAEPEEAAQPAPRAARPPLVGSSEADFRQRYGACVELDSPFVEAGGTRVGDAWRLVPSDACREAHPELGELLVFTLEGQVFNVAPRSALKTVVRTDAGWQPEEAPPAEGP